LRPRAGLGAAQLYVAQADALFELSASGMGASRTGVRLLLLLAATIAVAGLPATISTWSALRSSIGAAGGKTATLTLSTPFTGPYGSAIDTNVENTAITIRGNGAVFGAGGQGRFFLVYASTCALAISNATTQHGMAQGGGAIQVYNAPPRVYAAIVLTGCIFRANNGTNSVPGGGAIFLESDGPMALTRCTFDENLIGNSGGAIATWGACGDIAMTSCVFNENTHGAIYYNGGTRITFTDCTFSSSTNKNGEGAAIIVGGAGYGGTISLTNCVFRNNTLSLPCSGCAGGALFFGGLWSAGIPVTVSLKNCSFIGPISARHNDIARKDSSVSVTSICPDGELGRS
jgi:hypothetical protein